MSKTANPEVYKFKKFKNFKQDKKKTHLNKSL